MKLHLQISEELGSALLDEALKDMPSDFAARVRANPVRSSEMMKLAIERRLVGVCQTPIEEHISNQGTEA